MDKKTIPVLLLTGYLGSGKTTLVNRILANRKGIRFAVIVNDIGEINIDAGLIQKGGVVTQQDDSLVALQNGCICCTLKTDLVEQIFGLVRCGKFDYIVIEASGICEPEPIAQTICSIPTFGGAYTEYGICRLDCIVTVVDALRMKDEFSCGKRLERTDIGEEDLERLIIQQIEFCDMILLNKASEVSPDELARIRAIVRTLQPGAEIVECDYADIELDRILNTGKFDFDKFIMSLKQNGTLPKENFSSLKKRQFESDTGEIKLFAKTLEEADPRIDKDKFEKVKKRLHLFFFCPIIKIWRIKN